MLVTEHAPSACDLSHARLEGDHPLRRKTSEPTRMSGGDKSYTGLLGAVNKQTLGLVINNKVDRVEFASYNLDDFEFS